MKNGKQMINKSRTRSGQNACMIMTLNKRTWTYANQNIIELASKESADEIARNLAELKLNIVKSLDDIKVKLTKEQDKFDILRKALPK